MDKDNSFIVERGIPSMENARARQNGFSCGLTDRRMHQEYQKW